MKKIRKLPLVAAMAIAMLGVGGKASFAGPSDPAPFFKVSLTVEKGCGFTGPGDFEFFPPSKGTAADFASRSVKKLMTVTCSENTRFHLRFSGSSDVGTNGQSRFMTGSKPGNRDTINYQLKVASIPIGKTNVSSYDSIGSGGPENIELEAAIQGDFRGAGGRLLTADTYQDLITIYVEAY